ncbi:hypothetical protein NC653_037419 [Populus alba x Populus x berolinensis]|uniref:Uncharacterized protein n=1 Tax=Populus alba x Populus x berolinensis TaxID=444605 RepID=A0AAD6LE93_9ROSI|nr:hypothetical protein NC653_037419 [Populus alba x Populus x berolinensis]
MPTFSYGSVLKPAAAFLSHLKLKCKKFIASHNHVFGLEIRGVSANVEKLVDFVWGSISLNLHGRCGRPKRLSRPP